MIGESPVSLIVSRERSAMRLARAGVVAITSGFIANLLLLDLLARDVRARIDNDLDPAVGLGSDALRFAVGLGAIACYLPVMLGFGAVVYWSYRAACTGNALGIPARREVVFGVASWFIPVVNFWWPYEVIVDSLPMRVRGRHWVLTWWIVWQVALYVAPIHFINGLFGWPSLDQALLVAAIVVLISSGGLGWVALGIVTRWHVRAIADPVAAFGSN
jgi:hypothetical protein